MFAKTFPVIHSLLDAKLTSVLTLCHDQVTITAVQNIIQNMVVGGEIGYNQQQLHYLYSIGFPGLWRMASGPFKTFNECNVCNDNAKQFMKCLESLVGHYLPYEVEEDAGLQSDYKQLSTLTSSKSSGMLYIHADGSQHSSRHNRQTSMDQSIQLNSGSLSSVRSDASALVLKKNSSSENDLISTFEQSTKNY